MPKLLPKQSKCIIPRGLRLFTFFALHTARAVETGPCECHSDWAVCRAGFGEDGGHGCGGGHDPQHKGKSCADICSPGVELPWKPLYRATVAKEAELEAQCSQDPTKKWGQAPNPSTGPYAVAFSGGMRNFVTIWYSWQKNLIEPSGGGGKDDKRKTPFHLYFHVWRDENSGRGSPLATRGKELAESLPYTKAYVEEPFHDHEALVHSDEPDWIAAVNSSRTSWLSRAYSSSKRQAPFVMGATFSQFRKVYLALQLVKGSGVAYSLVIRARPDHIFLAPMDLRHFGSDFAKRPSVKNARGHFLAVPERSPQLVTDQFAVGTLSAVSSYAEKPLPYTAACCEGYVERNLNLRCFSHSRSVLEEEFGDVPALLRALADSSSDGSQPDPQQRDWRLVPPQVKRASAYSPIMLSQRAVGALGVGKCATPGGGGCVPLYRTKYMYIHRIVTRAWLGAGVVCVGLMGDGFLSGPMLVRARIASGVDLEAGKKYGFGPCLKVPTLEQAWKLTTALLNSFTANEQQQLRDHVGR
mmetsp:Transcript_37419/g.74108  ORF Transcript_37419/g.74108 Transcript_37419/m.74108 type:complete len:526 (+) Transcript_37419:108-1685(+)